MSLVDELPYFLPQLDAPSAEENIIESLAKHRFAVALITVASKHELRKFERLKWIASKLGMSLLPILTIRAEPDAQKWLPNQLRSCIASMSGQILVALKCSQIKEVEAALLNLSQLAWQLKGRTCLLWIDFPNGTNGEHALAIASKLSGLIAPDGVCMSIQMLQEDVTNFLKQLRKRFGDIRLWVALRITNMQCRVNECGVNALIPIGDQVRHLAYVAAVGGAYGIVMPDIHKLMHAREDLFKAASAVAAETQITSPYWRSSSKHRLSLSLELECDDKNSTEGKHIGAYSFVTKCNGGAEVLIAVLQKAFHSPSQFPTDYKPVTLRYPLSDAPFVNMPRAYSLNFPTPKRLRMRSHGNFMSLMLPKFEIAECVLVSSEMRSVEELHLRMNAFSASVMQFEIQWALKEQEMARALINSLGGGVESYHRELLRQMNECISRMLLSARGRQLARAIDMAKCFRRHYRGLLKCLAASSSTTAAM